MSEILGELRYYYDWFWQALFPPKCLICKKEGRDLCLRHHRFEKAPKSTANFKYLDDIFAATRYRQKTSEKVIEYFKFKGFKHLSGLMAEEVDRSLPNEFVAGFVLVPVPLHWTRKFWRGFNQAEVLAQSLIKINPQVSTSNDLKRVKRTKQQAKLGKTDRLKNLENAFVWTGPNIPPKVILIDDVVASGSTLDAAAKVLKDAGAKEVRAVVFARGGK